MTNEELDKARSDEALRIYESTINDDHVTISLIAARLAREGWTPHLRQVFVMRYKLGMAVGKENRADEDPSDPSIAFHFNVSARTVGKWLAKAEAQLASYRKA